LGVELRNTKHKIRCLGGVPKNSFHAKNKKFKAPEALKFWWNGKREN